MPSAGEALRTYKPTCVAGGSVDLGSLSEGCLAVPCQMKYAYTV